MLAYLIENGPTYPTDINFFLLNINIMYKCLISRPVFNQVGQHAPNLPFDRKIVYTQVQMGSFFSLQIYKHASRNKRYKIVCKSFVFIHKFTSVR